jgi:crotonobetaine/carnitine-CoA ligase
MTSGSGYPPGASGDQPSACVADPGLVLPAILRRRAGTDAGRPFLVEVGGRAWTYRDTWRGVLLRMAALAELGMRRSQTVGSFLPQSADAHLLWLAAALLGVRYVPVNPQLRGEFLQHVLRDAGVRRAFARPGQVAGLRDAGLPPGLDLIGVEPDAGSSPGGRWGQALARAVPSGSPVLPTAADVATVIYTSGTTGPAKGVLVTWGQIANAVGLRERDRFTSADAYFTPWPPFHVMGITPLAVMADAGGRVVVRDGPSVSRFWSDVDGYGCTAATIGPIAALLMDQPAGPGGGHHALRSVTMGPVIPDVDAFRARFEIEVMTVYGSSEIAYPLVSREVTGANRHLVGQLRAGYRARIVDGALEDVRDGSAGELLVRPPDRALASPGYLGQPELTRRVWASGYYRTGDTFIRHADGTFEFRDRLNDTIRRFGENISSAQVESVVTEADGVMECAVVGVPDEMSGQEIHLAVVPASGATLDPALLAARLAQVLPRYMRPSFVSIWDQLPKTPNGKIRKSELRAAGVPAGAWRAERRRGRRPA